MVSDGGKKGDFKKKATPADTAGRPPPSNLDIEKTVLATVLLVQLALLRVRGTLRAEHFFGPQHAVIFTAALEVLVSGSPVDLTTVKAQLRATNLLEQAGGASYLAEITQGATAGEHILAYADRIVELWERRLFQQWTVEARAETYDAVAFRTFRAEKMRELSRMAHGGTGPGELERLAPSITASMSDAQQRRAGDIVARVTPTGYTSLDRKTGGGIADEDLWVLAGRPGSGKTSLALGIANNISVPIDPRIDLCVPELGVALFELEMPKAQISGRLICMNAGIPFEAWRSGNLDDAQWGVAGEHASRLLKSNLWLDDTSDLMMAEIEAKTQALKSEWDRPATFAKCPVCQVTDLVHHAQVNRWHCPTCSPDPMRAGAVVFDNRTQLTRERRISVVMIDNMSLVKEEKETYSREREVATMSKYAKSMAKRKRLNMGVVLLVHLGRDVDKRKGKERVPVMSDLRETGSLEQDADVILFPWRPGYYKPDDQKIQHVASFIVAKQRNGPTGEIDVHYEPTCSRFDDLQVDLPPGL